MSLDCLWAVQTADYQFIYISHYIGLAWLAVAALMDLTQLASWTTATHGQRRMTLFGSSVLLAPWYELTLALATLAITLTWTTIVRWSTDNGLGWLALGLFGLIVVVAAASGALAHTVGGARRHTTAPVRGCTQPSEP